MTAGLPGLSSCARVRTIERAGCTAGFALGEDIDPSGAGDDRPLPRGEKLVTSNLTKSWLRPSSGHYRHAAVRGNRLRTRGRWAAALRAFPAVRDSMERSPDEHGRRVP